MTVPPSESHASLEMLPQSPEKVMEIEKSGVRRDKMKGRFSQER